MSSSSVAPFCLARPRWNTSCSVLPPVVSAATVTRLRSFGESCGRFHACPNSTSSVKCTSAGAKSPNIFSAPDGSRRSAFPVMVWSFLMSETSGAGRDPQRCGGRLWADHRVDVGAAEARVLAAVRPVDRGVEVGPVGVGRLVEGDVAFDAAGPDTTRVGVYRPAEPAVVAPSVGAHVQVVADPYDPDGGVRARRSVRVQGCDLEFVGGADPVEVVGGPGAHRVAISMMEVVPVAASPLSTAGAGCRLAAGWSSRPDIAAANATPDASSRLVRSPAWRPPGPASSAPKTATASAPPTCRLVLNTPLAVPVRCPGAAASSTAVTGGMTSGPASPTRTMSVANAQTGVAGGMSARAVRPAVITARPAVMTVRAPSRSAMRALNGVSTAPISIIGRNATPVANGERPRSCCRYRLITKGSP